MYDAMLLRDIWTLLSTLKEESKRPVARALHRSAGSHIKEKKSAQRDLDGEFRERVAASGDLGCAQ